MWRFHDHPMPGTIYRLPDDLTLQRGITYTFLPDGRRMRVPAMNRLDVRAEAQGHQENEDTDIAQALKQLLGGKKPTGDDARFDRAGRARRPHRQQAAPAVRRDVHGQGMRGIPMQG
tara:strand:- start:44 stop:394 length:351 start_codon:yes stop_codon:yes gene_type:complete